MPRVFLFKPAHLLLCFGKLKVVKVVQCLGSLELHGRAVNENNSSVFFRLSFGREHDSQKTN